MKNKNRLKREQKTVSKMIALYCRSHHDPPPGHLCPDCQSLAEYAHQRIDRCPYELKKPTCVKCPIHCYKQDLREEIRTVMRYSGPRMLLHHPILAIYHLVDGFRRPPVR
ncbi:MAG: nitrous oxide-stimulated promoter family protein [Brevefilum sp.]|nr:nitrous oxide-stimulated promoter family protein [Brevefilum sp.]